MSWVFGKCERVTSTGKTIRELDGLRFLALFLVFVLHMNHWVLRHPGIQESFSAVDSKIAHSLEFGTLGVQLFFLISGFILGLPFAKSSLLGRKRLSLKEFYLRRLSRLEPPLVIHLIFAFSVLIIIEGWRVVDLLPHFLATVTYLHSHLFGYFSPLNEMTWSLEVEAQFYLFTPILCLLFKVRSDSIRKLLFLFGIFGFAAIGNSIPKTILLVQLPFFFGGFLLVDLFLVTWKEVPQKSYRYDLLGCVSILLFVFFCVWINEIPLVNAWLSLSMVTLCVSAFRGKIFNRLFSIRFFATVGGMCYTFYLYHLMVIAACSRFFLSKVEMSSYLQAFALYFLVCGISTLVIGSLLFVCFEKPFMRWRPGKSATGESNRPNRVR